MRRKWVPFILPFILAMMVLAGCNGETSSQNEPEQIADELRPEKKHSTTDEEVNDKLGYVRYQRDQVNDDREKQRSVRIDRSEMADMITRMILHNDDFDEVATLVTDQEALIAYQLNEDANNKTAADIANKTAKSALPGFFDVYVSDNSHLMNDIQSLHNSSTNKNYDNTIDQIIKRMEESSPDDQDQTEQ